MVAELVRRHHEAQKSVARNLVAELSPLWNILQFHDLRGTEADWLKAVRPVIERHFLVSQYTAAQFVNEYRSTLFPVAERLPVDLPNPLGLLGSPQIPDRQVGVKIMVSMKVTGPLWLMENSIPGMDQAAMQELSRQGFSKSTGAAIRLTLNGGRGMVRLLADVDDYAVGVAGVADEDACNSCHFLETPIYKADGGRKMDAVAIGHDFCKCSARLVY